MEITLKGHTIKMYDDIDLLPIDRFTMFNRCIMLDSEIGGSLVDIDKRLLKTHQFIDKDMKDEAFQEIHNLRSTFTNVLNNISPNNYTFACMVRSINGVPETECTIERIGDVIKILAKYGLTNKKLKSTIVDLKKK